jgi:hypothetical protein
MPAFKRSVNFLPQVTEEEIEEKYNLTKTGLYAAVLPLLASFIWVIATLISGFYKAELKQREDTIEEKKLEIETYKPLRKKQSELIIKIEALSELVQKDFYPQKFFDDVTNTLQSTGDAQAEIYAYSRNDDGTFGIQGKANSYLDLSKIMVVFNNKDEFDEVVIKSIRYDKDFDNVNFEISFIYNENNNEE